MNFRNLAMWAVIVILTIGLYNMFKNPQGTVNQKNNIIFSEFLTQVDNGRVVQVEIQGKNIKGVMSNGEMFNTYAPDDPNLIQKLSDKGVSISASPLEEKMPSKTLLITNSDKIFSIVLIFGNPNPAIFSNISRTKFFISFLCFQKVVI